MQYIFRIYAKPPLMIVVDSGNQLCLHQATLLVPFRKSLPLKQGSKASPQIFSAEYIFLAALSVIIKLVYNTD